MEVVRSTGCDTDTSKLDFYGPDLEDWQDDVEESLLMAKYVLMTKSKNVVKDVEDSLDNSVKSLCRDSSRKSRLESLSGSETSNLLVLYVSDSCPDRKSNLSGGVAHPDKMFSL